MAKALIGYMNSDLRTPALIAAENSALRRRVRELEALVLRLSEENDTLTAAEHVSMLDLETASMQESMQEMQPA